MVLEGGGGCWKLWGLEVGLRALHLRLIVWGLPKENYRPHTLRAPRALQSGPSFGCKRSPESTSLLNPKILNSKT